MKSYTVLNRTCLVLAILWMAVIFVFSHRPADLSEQDSSLVGEIILHIAVPDFDNLSPAVQSNMLERITYPVRKCAHMTEYALLAVLLLGAFYTPARAAGSDKSFRAKPAPDSLQKLISQLCTSSMASASRNAFIITLLYAATDEFHQLFVSGRSGEITDICIDACGACIGLLIARIFFVIHTSRAHS